METSQITLQSFIKTCESFGITREEATEMWKSYYNLRKTNEIYENAADYLEHFDVSDRDMVKFIIGTIGDIDTPMNPAAKGSRSMNLYMNHVSAEMIREERNQILDAQQSDIRALADVLQALLDAHELCVIGSEEKIEEQKEMFLEIKTL